MQSQSYALTHLRLFLLLSHSQQTGSCSYLSVIVVLCPITALLLPLYVVCLKQLGPVHFSCLLCSTFMWSLPFPMVLLVHDVRRNWPGLFVLEFFQRVWRKHLQPWCFAAEHSIVGSFLATTATHYWKWMTKVLVEQYLLHSKKIQVFKINLNL